MTKRGYLIINYVFAGIILAIFVYSGVYKPESNSHPIKCIHEELLGQKCPTCGMSRGFSAIVRGNIEEAQAFQKNSLPVFSFFAIQLMMRTMLLILLLKSQISIKALANIDITLSLLLFMFTFKNLIFQTIYIFYKMLLTGNVA